MVIDYEQGPTSSEAFNTIGTLSMQAVRATGSTLAPASATIGVAVRLYSFLLNAYLLDVSYTVHTVDFGVQNAPGARDFIESKVMNRADGDAVCPIHDFCPLIYETFWLICAKGSSKGNTLLYNNSGGSQQS